jgi:hypothetical protein
MGIPMKFGQRAIWVPEKNFEVMPQVFEGLGFRTNFMKTDLVLEFREIFFEGSFIYQLQKRF